MREINFDFIYKLESGFRHKKYALESIMIGMNRICDLWDRTPIAIRQGTGLKDKNGKEVFSEDIFLDDTCPVKVTWDIDNAQYAMEHYIGDGKWENMHAQSWDEWVEFIKSESVWGNIYENGDFLK